jgi:glycosyltransferase involved in cell wall biosynthesis
MMPSIIYFYPMYKNVSFSIISQKHIEQLKKYTNVYGMDEICLPITYFTFKPNIILHPFFHNIISNWKKIEKKRHSVKKIIGVDVADTDHLTSQAVNLTEYADAIIVPSQHSRKTYISSGVRKPVHVVAHGVDLQWILEPQQQPLKVFEPIEHLKYAHKMKIITAWVPHSDYRKGYDILQNIYEKLKKLHKIALVIKRFDRVVVIAENIPYTDIKKPWLTEQEKMTLFDMTDLYILSSRGGGFEHPALEAIARGVPVIASENWSWQEYLPKWALIKSHRSKHPLLEGNPIHDGYGVEMDIKSAVDKAKTILENIQEYKQKAKDYTLTHVKENLTWDKIGHQLKDTLYEIIGQ